MHVKGAKRTAIASTHHIRKLVQHVSAIKKRGSSSTSQSSSLSSLVCILYITGKHFCVFDGTGICVGVHETLQMKCTGCLYFVDLPSGERHHRSKTDGHSREKTSTNTARSALGRVFTALAENKTQIPYSDSKLTHLLQDCLGKSGKSLMIANVCPSFTSIRQSLETLKFVTKVHKCGEILRGQTKKLKTDVLEADAAISKKDMHDHCSSKDPDPEKMTADKLDDSTAETEHDAHVHITSSPERMARKRKQLTSPQDHKHTTKQNSSVKHSKHTH